uniref:Uncharacterized protein n=1 Tax=Oryzias sinensis TaxID=183150 RepID=A0A8C7X0X1_9TELE
LLVFAPLLAAHGDASSGRRQVIDGGSVVREALALMARKSSASSLWMTLFRLLLFSFSFSYFFFHSSAVSSRFTQTVFLMVLALKKCQRFIGFNESKREAEFRSNLDILCS